MQIHSWSSKTIGSRSRPRRDVRTYEWQKSPNVSIDSHSPAIVKQEDGLAIHANLAHVTKFSLVMWENEHRTDFQFSSLHRSLSSQVWVKVSNSLALWVNGGQSTSISLVLSLSLTLSFFYLTFSRSTCVLGLVGWPVWWWWHPWNPTSRQDIFEFEVTTLKSSPRNHKVWESTFWASL